MTLDLHRFDFMSFDVYGTLIDWESGIIQAMCPILRQYDLEWTNQQILQAFARYETVAQQPPYLNYPDVLSQVLEAIFEELGIRPSTEDLAAFAGSVPDWPAFEDSSAALSVLNEQFRLAVVTNCDDALFAASNHKLGVTFDIIVTAEQARVYKPDLRPFETLIDAIGGEKARLVHVAQSLYHDHEPAKKLDLASVWINRGSARPGFGAAPAADARPDLELPDLSALAALVE